MKRVYHCSGNPVRPDVARTPAEEEAFQLAKELVKEISNGAHSKFWRKSATGNLVTSPDDFDIEAIKDSMKKKYSLLSDELIARKIARYIYVYHLR